MNQIQVTKTFLPPVDSYVKYIKRIWKSNQLTNQGSLVKEFEEKLIDYINAKNIHFVNNGTSALQLALNALGIKDGEIITTPFSYVATTSAILWERCEPVYVDINPNTLCIDANKIEKHITKKTKAILAVHVFGIPCEVEAIELIAKKHKLKVIYDGAHAFGVKYKNKSLLSYGDISICSFHATKVFHTIEGGCLVIKDKKISEKVDLIKRFGHLGDDHFCLGINAKASEFQAAMGLVNFKYLKFIIDSRKKIFEIYDSYLKDTFDKPKIPKNITYNYSYYPIILKSEEKLLKVVSALNKSNIFPRRYFYPSLNKLPYLTRNQSCPISEDISTRILCLPIYHDLKTNQIKKICKLATMAIS